MMELDKYQRQIVYSKHNNILVIASAGSGKTRVLTERIKYLVLTRNVDPRNIITITFTNQAAGEMKDRLADLPGVNDLFIGTIHSFAFRILKSINKQLILLTDELDRTLHLELINKYCKILTYNRYIEFTQAQIQYSKQKISSEDLANFLTPGEKRELYKIESGTPSAEYPESIQSLCKIRGIITFTELLKLATEYLKNNNLSSEYVFVDEFQDIGTLEYKFILSLKSPNYFFVGDDWQSIYSFKGSNVGIFENLYVNPNYKNYFLTINYRSKVDIIKYCSRIMKLVNNKFNKEVMSNTTEHGLVVTTNQMYLDNIITHLSHQKDLSNWMILTRTNAEVYEIQDLLEAHNIRCSLFKRKGSDNSAINNLLKDNSVKIMTVHSSKGLESDNVILYGKFSLNKKLYAKQSDSDYEHKLFRFEEEYKVFYVGASRARNKLIVVDTDKNNFRKQSVNLNYLS